MNNFTKCVISGLEHVKLVSHSLNDGVRSIFLVLIKYLTDSFSFFDARRRHQGLQGFVCFQLSQSSKQHSPDRLRLRDCIGRSFAAVQRECLVQRVNLCRSPSQSSICLKS